MTHPRAWSIFAGISLRDCNNSFLSHHQADETGVANHHFSGADDCCPRSLDSQSNNLTWPESADAKASSDWASVQRLLPGARHVGRHWRTMIADPRNPVSFSR